MTGQSGIRVNKQRVPTLTGTIHHQNVDGQERTHEHGGVSPQHHALPPADYFPAFPSTARRGPLPPAAYFPAVTSSSSHLTGEDIHICLLGTCLLMTYVPSVGPRLIVSTPCYEQQGI